MQPKVGGKLHLRLNTAVSPIANKYREGNLKRTCEERVQHLEGHKVHSSDSARLRHGMRVIGINKESIVCVPWVACAFVVDGVPRLVSWCQKPPEKVTDPPLVDVRAVGGVGQSADRGRPRGRCRLW